MSETKIAPEVELHDINEINRIKNLGISIRSSISDETFDINKYKYKLRLTSSSKLLKYLSSAVQLNGNKDTTSGSSIFWNKYIYVIYGIEIYALEHDQSFNKYNELYFISLEEAAIFEKYIKMIYDYNQSADQRCIYTYSYSWQKKGKYDVYDRSNYIGYDKYIDKILADKASLKANFQRKK